MLRDARIQLEGQLELFEQGIAELRSAAAHARRGDFGPLAAALSADHNFFAIERLATQEPGLRALLEERRRLEAVAERLVKARARTLQNPERPLLAALRELSSEPVLYEGAARSPLTWVIAGFLSLLIAGEVSQFGLAPLFVHGVAVVALVIFALRAPTLRVTSRRVFLGRESVELAQIRFVRVHRTLSRSNPFRVTIDLHQGGSIEKKLSSVADEFCEALRSCGVSVSRTGWLL